MKSGICQLVFCVGNDYIRLLYGHMLVRHLPTARIYGKNIRNCHSARLFLQEVSLIKYKQLLIK